MSLLKHYNDQATLYAEQLNRVQQRSTLVAVLRLVAFVALAIAAYNGFWYHQTIGMLVSCVLAVVFILLIRLAFQLRDKKALLEKLLFIHRNEAGMLQQQPNQFGDGQSFLSYENYAADLDVFGAASLFHLLNRTTTQQGAYQLAHLLQQPLLSAAVIRDQQEAVQTLAAQHELRTLLMAHGLLHNEKEGTLQDIMAWLQQPASLLTNRWIKYIRWILPAINIGCIVFYLFTDNYGPLSLGALLSWAFIGVYAKRIQHQHLALGKKKMILAQYATILQLFSKASAGQSVVLQQQKDIAGKAHTAIKKLSSLSAMFDQRLNLIVNIFLNSFFLYDIQVFWALEKWKNTHQPRFAAWIDCVGNIETLNSLATLAFNNPGYIYPVVATDTLLLQTEQMAHPLIPATERVPNSFTMGRQEQLVLVTGSNMSGKTTFLRTIGVNLLLAQCGAPVCAASFTFSPMTILSSIRISDSLKENTSYFMAELKRLKHIILHLQQGHPSLVLIDEILRGTNSEEKTHGSEQFIKKLLQYNCLTLFATHDLALSRMEQELAGQVSNYCFESRLQEGELLFDYLLQHGVAKNKNASFLMQKMDII